ncbi:hypothetical protein WICMUC_002415 [Wickerhamomyces mucosus]|uniref:THUMP domain-containing protein n=1 Tax=Wickerhamomyces mucosus TaxID=1378264 RepID=A0A9P8PPW8_9ASCO|nr:hypothetical protein WICMUC_002415 [Wickerhamomyces mucosus]
MGKRKNGGDDRDHPQTSGIYATCQRKAEKKCEKELSLIFEEKLNEWYPEELNQDDDDDDNDDDDKNEDDDDDNGKELSIEESIKKELQELNSNDNKHSKDKGLSSGGLKPKFQFIDLGCECVIFCKTRKPIDPVEFVTKLCQFYKDSSIKSTRFTQKLTPITLSSSGSEEELIKLAKIILKPHFHKEINQSPLKFAIQVTRRNFNVLGKDEIIRKIAECVGKSHGHSVDLKNFDKLIIVECFKNNIGMSVVDQNYSNELEKFNLQMIFEKNQINNNNELSRVKPTI